MQLGALARLRLFDWPGLRAVGFHGLHSVFHPTSRAFVQKDEPPKAAFPGSSLNFGEGYKLREKIFRQNSNISAIYGFPK
jgi:hypothetical protein